MRKIIRKCIIPDIMSKTTLSKRAILLQVWKFIKWVPNLQNSAANYNISLTNGRPYLCWMGKSVTLICPWVYHRVNMYLIRLVNVFAYPTPPKLNISDLPCLYFT